MGELNIKMVSLANSLGFSAKFTGSGGALLCLQRNGQGWYVLTYSYRFFISEILLIHVVILFVFLCFCESYPYAYECSYYILI